jgi:beta-galactosidase
MKKIVLAAVGVLCVVGCAAKPAQETLGAASGSGRWEMPLGEGWKFLKADPLGAEKVGVSEKGWQAVTVPHTWNNLDGEDGGFEGRGNYLQTGCWYRRHLVVTPAMAGKTLVLKFEGANRRTDVFVNGVKVGKHIGGFAAFTFDITQAAKAGDNLIAVRVTNEHDDESAPLSADFTFFGGLYRPVELLVLDSLHISPLDAGSSGVVIGESDVSTTAATVHVKALVRNAGEEAAAGHVVMSIVDAAGNRVASAETETRMLAGVTVPVEATMVLAHPHLWNGRRDPYLYQVVTDVVRGGKVVDEVVQPLGVRTFSIDKERGFLLNGQPYALHGVNRHQDRPDKGWAISDADHDEDMAMILEMGCTAIRLAHYQHAEHFYQLCDKAGLVVWAEVPVVDEITPDKGFATNAKQQLTELIRQNINHPSICFWSLGNEITALHGSPVPLLKEMNAVAHEEDPSRLTTMAFANSAGGSPREWPGITDVVGKNRYYGWYDGELPDFAAFLATQGSVAISEYGAGSSVYFHAENPVRMDHTEEYQCLFHEAYWPAIAQKKSVWAAFIWNMFDFAADQRKEGDHAGRNDKGMVTYDRKTRKDVFYYYQANWSDEPVVHINSKRFAVRGRERIAVKVYSNAEAVELWVNGVSVGVRQGSYCVFTWEGVGLKQGVNQVVARGMRKGKMIEDRCEWTYTPGAPEGVYVGQDETMREALKKGPPGAAK